MASRRTLFARALPSEIRIEETYPYVARVRSVPQVLLPPHQSGEVGPAPAEGLIEVCVPYDGQRFFGPRAVRDVSHHSLSSVALDEGELHAQVGHLIVRQYGRIKLAGSDLLALDGVVPVSIPVRGDLLAAGGELSAGRKEARVRLTYEPERPHTPPLHVTMAVSDEEALYEIQRQLQAAEKVGDLKGVQRLWAELARQMGRKAEFAPALRLSFDVQLELPATVGLADDPDPPQLKLLWLRWPGVPSYRRVQLFVEDHAGQMQPHPLSYEPTSGRLQWGGLRFLPPPGETSNGFYNYHAPRMILQVREPGELLGAGELAGNVVVEIPRLFSGLELQYFDALGESYPVNIRATSRLEMALGLDVEDCFNRRRFSPYHYLQFPGVQLNQMRLGDIIAQLESIQFTVPGEPVDITPDEASVQQGIGREYLLAATRAEGAGQLWLWLRVSDRLLRGEWLHDAGDNDHPSLHLHGDTHMTIAIRSELDGASHAPVQVLNQLHDRLKRRFRFERAVS